MHDACFVQGRKTWSRVKAIGRAGRWRSCCLNWMVRVGLILKGTFEQRLEGVEGISQIVLTGKSILRVRTARSKSLEGKQAWRVVGAANNLVWLEQSERGEEEEGSSAGN